VQYWNRVDFYSTELRVTSPGGSTETHTLDGDDSKSWRLPLVVDEQRQTARRTRCEHCWRSTCPCWQPLRQR
jgi:hypothetical protein